MLEATAGIILGRLSTIRHVGSSYRRRHSIRTTNAGRSIAIREPIVVCLSRRELWLSRWPLRRLWLWGSAVPSLVRVRWHRVWSVRIARIIRRIISTAAAISVVMAGICWKWRSSITAPRPGCPLSSCANVGLAQGSGREAYTSE